MQAQPPDRPRWRCSRSWTYASALSSTPSPSPRPASPAFQLWIDFGEAIGTKRSSAQITVHYKPDQLIGRQVCAVVNFPPRQIGPFTSEVLTLGLPSEEGEVILLRPDFAVPDGGRLY